MYTSYVEAEPTIMLLPIHTVSIGILPLSRVEWALKKQNATIL